MEALPCGEKVMLKTDNFDNPVLKYSQAAVKEDVFNILREAHLATGH
jgi:hypothetical protein